jgi:uncharacterized low-complexity protein
MHGGNQLTMTGINPSARQSLSQKRGETTMSKMSYKPVATAIGAAFVGSMLVAGSASAGTNPFGLSELNGGYAQIADSHMDGKCGGNKGAEGKCGGEKAAEGKCGGDKAAEGKCGAGKCGGEKAAEGKCGGEKAAEGKCGAGKCGANK